MSCKGTNLTAIIQLTDMCNLGCKYCYVGEEGKSRMSIDTFKTALDKLIAAAGEGSVDIIYHGGEPLARGFDFIKATTKIIEESPYRERVRADIQTNGTLLDDKVAKFLVEHNISCGISLDGPKEVHDANRVYKCGKKGSFDDVMAGIDNLREAGYAPGVLSVVTKKSLGKEKEIYDFFNSEGLSFGLNPIDLVGCLKSKEDELGITPKEYGQYLINLFDIWYNDKDTNITITNLRDTMAALTFGRSFGCLYSCKACGTRFYGIAPTGDVYPCNRFAFDDKFKIGNVLEDSFEEMSEHPVYVEFKERSKKIEECQGCKYNDLCNSGCPSRAYSEHGTIGRKDKYCASTIMLFDHIAETLEGEVDFKKEAVGGCPAVEAMFAKG